MPRNRRETELRERKIRIGVVTSCAVLGLLGIIACGYGHAAFNTDLQISGEATVKNSNDRVPFPITYLQDMTPEICANATYHTESQLIDKRDGKKYWVRKQYDGTCWMVQNLALDITSEGLTSELSDINYSSEAQYEEETKPNGEVIYKWNENSKYPPVDTYHYFSNSGSSYTTTRSWNLGDYVSIYPDYVKQCNTNKVGPSACDQLAYVGEVWETNDNGENIFVAPAYEPTLNYEAGGMAYDDENRTYDAHYLIGNYYQYRTATAGSYTRVKNAFNSSSICPKGWRLPTTDNATTADSPKEAKTALEAYSEATGESVNIWLEPMYFMRAGTVESGNYTYAGGRGAYLMGRTSATNVAISGNTIASTYSDMRGITSGSALAYGGNSVRCVARTGLEEE